MSLDYLHLTKALGHIALANLPLQILLSPKLAAREYHPLLRFAGIHQALLSPYHRLFARIVIFPLLALHSILYLTFFYLQTNPALFLSKRLEDNDVQTGVMGAFITVFMWGTVSTRTGKSGQWWRQLFALRKKMSKWGFYTLHVSVVFWLLFVAYSHVSYARGYILQGLGIYGLDILGYLVGLIAGKQKV